MNHEHSISPSPQALVLFAHPSFERSQANRILIDAAGQVDGVTIHDLYETYPDLDVDPNREQALLARHPVVLMQFPFYWYSTPALLKQWQDLVLEYGWAYGHGGTALHGKLFACALTAGGGQAGYQPGGSNGCTIDELLAPLRQTARLCGMLWQPPFVVFGTHHLDRERSLEIRASYQEYLRQLVERAPKEGSGVA